MPWVRIDDHYAEHPKMAAVGPLGHALWLAGLAYCNRNLTDGFIPWSTADRLIAWTFLDEDKVTRIYVGSPDYVHEDNAVTSEYVIAILLDNGVWDKVPGGYRIHDYADYQPTKAQVLADRAAKVAAGRAGGLAAARARAEPDAVAQSKPVPNPVPVPVSGSTTGSTPRDSPLPPASGGNGLRANGTNPRQLADNAKALEREARRQEAMTLHQRYLRGEINEAEYEALKADIGKPADDMTRTTSSKGNQ